MVVSALEEACDALSVIAGNTFKVQSENKGPGLSNRMSWAIPMARVVSIAKRALEEARAATPPIKEPLTTEAADGALRGVERLLSASPNDYWQPIVDEIEAAGRKCRHARLLNHQAAHVLAWAKIARDAAIARTALADCGGALSPAAVGGER